MAKKNAAAAPAPPPVEYASAMDKLRDEMAKSKDNYVRVVGEYLTGYLLDHPEAEAALMEKEKSISGSLKGVREEASKVKQGNVAILDDRTVYGIVLGYFGLKSAADVPKTEGNVLNMPGNVHKTGENVPGETTGGTTSSDPPQAAAHLTLAGSLGPAAPLKGKAFGETAQDPAPDPFDLDALLGVM